MRREFDERTEDAQKADGGEKKSKKMGYKIENLYCPFGTNHNLVYYVLCTLNILSNYN